MRHEPSASLLSHSLILLLAIILTLLSVMPVIADDTTYTSQHGVVTACTVYDTGCAVRVKYGNGLRVIQSYFWINNLSMCKMSYQYSINRVVNVYRTNGKVTSISLPKP